MIQKQYMLQHFSDEMLIDAGMGTPEMIARREAYALAAKQAWRALPWHIRMLRRIRARRWLY